MLSDIGLEVNLTKSEVSSISCDNLQSVLYAIDSALLGVTVTEREDLCILVIRLTSTVAVHECLKR